MSVLAIDIGNSRVGFNVFTAGKAQDAALRITHAQLDTDLASTLKSMWEKCEGETRSNEDDSSDVVIASVVPEVTTRIAQAVLSELGIHAKIIGEHLSIPLKTSLRDEKNVGTDRLLGAMASYVNVESACVIIQLGSALVVDCVDDEGIFRGGAIAPGLQMAARALEAHTAQLPEASLTPPTDDVPFGRFTQEAINLGLYIGTRGAIRELVERYATALGNWPHVVATGGDAQALLGQSELVDSFIPDLVLQGAALVWEHHRGDDSAAS